MVIHRRPYRDSQLPRAATAVNDSGQVVAVLQGANAPNPSTQRAYLYDRNKLIELPLYEGVSEPLERSDSASGAINNSSTIAGSVAVQKTANDRLKVLPAIFQVGKPLVALDSIKTAYGSQAVAINEPGHVLVKVDSEAFDVRSALWDPASDTWHYVGDNQANVFPIALTDNDVVLGQARNAHNQPVAVICKPGATWERLGTDDGWIPIDINNDGIVIGRVTIDQLTRPWIHYRGGQAKLLPYLTDHHTSPEAINNIGDIVGSASADNDTHALVWRVKR